MALLFDGTNDYGNVTLDNSGVNKISLAFWLYWVTNGTGFDLAFEVTADTNANTTGFYVSPDNPDGGGRFDITGKGNVGNTAALYSQPSQSAWHHHVVTFDKSLSSNEINHYLDGSLEMAGSRPSDSNTTNNFGNDPWYFMSRAGSTLFGNGHLGRVAVYPGILTDADCLALAKGADPRSVRPDLSPWYWEILGGSPLMELLHAAGLTITGAVESSLHPPVWFAE